MLFKKKKLGNIYAVTGGDYMGEFFVLVEETNKDYIFLSLPDFYVRHVPKDKYEFGVQNKILDFREKLPQDIFKDCMNKYTELKLLNHGKTIIDRRE